MSQIIQFVFSFRFFYAFAALLAGISSIFALTRQMQIFQQNLYRPKSYISQLKGKENKSFFLNVMLYIIYAVLVNNGGISVVVAALFVYLIVCVIKSTNVQKRSVVPLEFTPRVKRSCFALAVLVTLVTAGQYFLLGDVSYWALSINVLLCLFPYLTVLLLWALLYPIERKAKV